MTELRQRAPRQQDAKHLAFVRSQPCCVCGSTRGVEAAHIRIACPAIGKPETGMAQKPDDKWTTPLCHYHHQSSILAQHKVGEQVFWFEIHGRNPFKIAEKLWAESGGAAREPQKPKRPRKIKPRDVTKPKRQIPASPELHSRGFDKAPRQRSASRPLEKRI